jgi:hypothetical protein
MNHFYFQLDLQLPHHITSHHIHVCSGGVGSAFNAAFHATADWEDLITK